MTRADEAEVIADGERGGQVNPRLEAAGHEGRLRGLEECEEQILVEGEHAHGA